MTQVIWNSLITGSLYALVAVGFGLTYNVGNFFNMAHGASFLVGAYCGYVTLRVWELGLIPAVCVAAMAAGGLSVIVHLTVFERLARRRASRLAYFIASLGVLIVVESLAGAVFGYEVLVFRSGPSKSFSVPGGRLTSIQITALILSLAAFSAMYLFFNKTGSGRRIRAISDDRELATAIGVPVAAVLARVHFIGAALAGIAGVMVGLELSVRPSLGMMAILWAMVASIIGGVGSFTGPILGAFILGAVDNVAVTVLPSEWKNSVVYSSLILFFFFRPRGLLGR